MTNSINANVIQMRSRLRSIQRAGKIRANRKVSNPMLNTIPINQGMKAGGGKGFTDTPEGSRPTAANSSGTARAVRLNAFLPLA